MVSVGRIINAAPPVSTNTATLPDAIAERRTGADRLDGISLTQLVGADPLTTTNRLTQYEESRPSDAKREAEQNLAEQQRQQVEMGMAQPRTVTLGGRLVDSTFLESPVANDPTRTAWTTHEVVASPLGTATISVDFMFEQTQAMIASGVGANGQPLTAEELRSLLRDLADLATLQLFRAKNEAGQDNDRGKDLSGKLAETVNDVAAAAINHRDTDLKAAEAIRDLVGGVRSALGAFGATGTRLDNWMAQAERSIAEAIARQAMADAAAREARASATRITPRGGFLSLEDEISSGKAAVILVDQALQVFHVVKALRPGDKDDLELRRAAHNAAVAISDAAARAEHDKVKSQIHDASEVRYSTNPIMLAAGKASALAAMDAIGGLVISASEKAALWAQLRDALTDIVTSMEELAKPTASSNRRVATPQNADVAYSLPA